MEGGTRISKLDFILYTCRVAIKNGPSVAIAVGISSTNH